MARIRERRPFQLTTKLSMVRMYLQNRANLTLFHKHILFFCLITMFLTHINFILELFFLQ